MTKKRTHTPYDYATILAAWETYPMRRIRFNKGETGWIAQLSATEGCLANIPLTGTHALYDIVEILPPTTQDGWSRMGQVLQRRYGLVGIVRYPTGEDEEATKAQYRQVVEAIHAAEGVCEGMIPGMALVNLPAGCDVDALFDGSATIEAVHALHQVGT